MTIDIFISYSHKDQDLANRLVNDLTARGLSVWVDKRRIEAGDWWNDAIQKAIKDCKVFLLLLTPASVQSLNVQEEIAYALLEKKLFIPILCEDCRIPINVRPIQFIDLNYGYRSGLEKLIKRIRREGIEIVDLPKTILIVDNDPNVLHLNQEFLDSGGYQIIMATSPEEARAMLSQKKIDLIVLGLRLVDVTDPDDNSGMIFAITKTDPLIPIIIYTAFPNYQIVRDLLTHSRDTLPLAIDVLVKGEGPHILQKAIERRFKEPWELL